MLCYIAQTRSKINFLFFVLLLVSASACSSNSLDQNPDDSTVATCPQEPSTALKNKNVRNLDLTNDPYTASGQIRADTSLGYAFVGQSGQKLYVENLDGLCLWIYSPSNQIVEGGKLLQTGIYTVQVATLKGMQTFNLELSLVSEPEPIAIAPSPEPSPIPSSVPEPEPISIPSPEPEREPEPEPQESQPRGTPTQSKEQILNDLADRSFYDKHPELRGRKLRSDEAALREEWNQIRRCEAVVDYIFYERHPELGQRRIRSGESALAREWNQIKSTVSGCRR